jgi:hypothetical protein
LSLIFSSTKQQKIVKAITACIDITIYHLKNLKKYSFCDTVSLRFPPFPQHERAPRRAAPVSCGYSRGTVPLKRKNCVPCLNPWLEKLARFSSSSLSSPIYLKKSHFVVSLIFFSLVFMNPRYMMQIYSAAGLALALFLKVSEICSRILNLF